MLQNFALIIYNITLSLWVGGIAIFSFIVTPVIFRSFTKEKAGIIVGHLFPGYFLYNLALTGIVCLALMFLHKTTVKWVYFLSIILAITSFLINVVHTKIVHPKVRDAKSQVYNEQNATSPDSKKIEILKSSFSKLHGVSMILNIIVFLEGLSLVILSTFLIAKP